MWILALHSNIRLNWLHILQTKKINCDLSQIYYHENESIIGYKF